MDRIIRVGVFDGDPFLFGAGAGVLVGGVSTYTAALIP